MKKIFIFSFLLSNYIHIVEAQEIFPKQQKCETFETQCTYNLDKICKKELCGGALKEFILNNYFNQNNFIGRKFNNLFEIEDYIKKHIPKEFAGYEIKITNKATFNNTDYDSRRIVIIIDNDQRVQSVTLN